VCEAIASEKHFASLKLCGIVNSLRSIG